MNHSPCRGPISRRGFMQIGGLALGGITLREVIAGRAAAGETRADTSVIMLYQHGGASQLETYDLKPNAPTEYRSIYRPIATNVPGLEICEKFPLQAKMADRFSLVRSLHHDVNIHSDGGIVVLTGKRPTQLDPTSQSKSEHPDFGSVASQRIGFGEVAIPPYVAIPQKPYMTRPTYLGLHHSAFETGDPASDDYQPPQTKLAAGRETSFLNDRQLLLKQFDRFRSDLDATGQMDGTDKFRDLAFQMLTSPRVAEAFEVDREPDELRERYGRNTWGQACLLARRLAEAGTSVINIYFNTPKTGEEFTNWDDHIMNAGRPGHFGKYMDVRLPYMDQALSTLIDDIWQRDLQQRILVVVVGEFGRTPRLSNNANGTGRDHWPQACSALLSGGSLKMGQVVGATNRKAEYPIERPYTPQDLLATIYRHLRIDPAGTLTDYTGRPVHILNTGHPIPELV
ncbi:MAG: DUF1501 domain-containing protein [Planctomycetota bacterium]|nr:MAG: DUF1501 domain-containing protein [Planctomycetota bacterium]